MDRRYRKALASGLLILLIIQLAGSLVESIYLIDRLETGLDAKALAVAAGRDSLLVMTMNAQQCNDERGQKSFARQLALVRRIGPDLLALKETDSARVSLNNNDYVRRFAEALGYHSYYGPRTTAGTYGTAILSRYPLEGARAKGERHAILLGDYNMRPDGEPYRVVAASFTNAWEAWRAEVAARGGPEPAGPADRDRIDHIFLSAGIVVVEAGYVLPPDSATDHPVHWARLAFPGG